MTQEKQQMLIRVPLDELKMLYKAAASKMMSVNKYIVAAAIEAAKNETKNKR